MVLFQFPKMIVLNFLLHSKIHHSCFLLICKMYSFIPKWIICSWHWPVTAVFSYTYYLVNVILFNKQYFQIKISNNSQRVYKKNTSIKKIPDAWNIHAVIVMFQHESFIHGIAELPRHCFVSLFLHTTYYLAGSWIVSYLLNSVFKLK